MNDPLRACSNHPDRPAWRRDLCSSCAHRFYRWGDPLDVRRNQVGVSSVPSREICAWAAGLLEGEGWIGREVGLQMTDLDVVMRFADAFGMPVYGPYTRERKKPIYSTKVQRFEAKQAIIAAVWPWLGKRRREQWRTSL